MQETTGKLRIKRRLIICDRPAFQIVETKVPACYPWAGCGPPSRGSWHLVRPDILRNLIERNWRDTKSRYCEKIMRQPCRHHSDEENSERKVLKGFIYIENIISHNTIIYKESKSTSHTYKVGHNLRAPAQGWEEDSETERRRKVGECSAHPTLWAMDESG